MKTNHLLVLTFGLPFQLQKKDLANGFRTRWYFDRKLQGVSDGYVLISWATNLYLLYDHLISIFCNTDITNHKMNKYLIF